jgi:hypothetical protein
MPDNDALVALLESMNNESSQYLQHMVRVFRQGRVGTSQTWGASIYKTNEVYYVLRHSYFASDNELSMMRNRTNDGNADEQDVEALFMPHLRGHFLVGGFDPPAPFAYRLSQGKFVVDGQDSPAAPNHVLDQDEIEVAILRALRRVRNELCPGTYEFARVSLIDLCAFLNIDELYCINALKSLHHRKHIHVKTYALGNLWSDFQEPSITEEGLSALQAREQDLVDPRFLTKTHRPAARLLRLLMERFAETDFKVLAFNLEINDEQLPGDTWVAQMLPIVRKAEKSGTLSDLIEAIIKVRADLKTECEQIRDSIVPPSK